MHFVFGFNIGSFAAIVFFENAKMASSSSSYGSGLSSSASFSSAHSGSSSGTSSSFTAPATPPGQRSSARLAAKPSIHIDPVTGHALIDVPPRSSSSSSAFAYASTSSPAHSANSSASFSVSSSSHAAPKEVDSKDEKDPKHDALLHMLQQMGANLSQQFSKQFAALEKRTESMERKFHETLNPQSPGSTPEGSRSSSPSNRAGRTSPAPAPVLQKKEQGPTRKERVNTVLGEQNSAALGLASLEQSSIQQLMSGSPQVTNPSIQPHPQPQPQPQPPQQPSRPAFAGGGGGVTTGSLPNPFAHNHLLPGAFRLPAEHYSPEYLAPALFPEQETARLAPETLLQDLLERRNAKRKFADRNAFLDAVEDTMRSFASIGDTNSMLQFWELTRYMLLLETQYGWASADFYYWRLMKLVSRRRHVFLPNGSPRSIEALQDLEREGPAAKGRPARGARASTFDSSSSSSSGSLHCDVHGTCSHTTADCRVARKKGSTAVAAPAKRA